MKRALYLGAMTLALTVPVVVKAERAAPAILEKIPEQRRKANESSSMELPPLPHRSRRNSAFLNTAGLSKDKKNHDDALSIGSALAPLEQTISDLSHLRFDSVSIAQAIITPRSTRAFAMSGQPQEDPSVHTDSHVSDDYPPPFGFSLTEHWLDPRLHAHFSRQGTPFVHLFSTEPAFLGRDLFLDYRIALGDEGYEVELEAELEWALTRRLGLVFEAPYQFLNPDEGSSMNGIGDVAIASRALLVDSERFMLAASVGISVPTGSERRGFGSGETSLSPSASWWCDLGKWVTFQGQIGTEHALDSGDTEFLWNAALTYSLLGPTFFGGSSPDAGHSENHSLGGLVHLIAELTGRTQINGEREGHSEAEILFGISYFITSEWGVRVAMQFPLIEPREFDSAFIFGLTYHF